MKKVPLPLFLFLVFAMFTSAMHAAVLGVKMQSTAFNPKTITVTNGDSIIWTNLDFSTHNVIGGTCASGANGTFTSANMNNGDKFTNTFNTTGTFPYFCSFHCGSSMTGMVTVVSGGNVAPGVSITNPANSAVFAIAPTNISIFASATGNGGATVTNVQFFANTNTLIGSSTGPTFTTTFSNVAAGSYALTAKATDNHGLSTTSSVVNITVNASPSVTITNPANNFVFTNGSTIQIGASASDSDGSITNVAFFVDSTLIINDTTTPYGATTNLTPGSYTLFAVASDNVGAKTTNSISISVNAPPAISFTPSLPVYTVSEGSQLSFQVNATDSDGPSLTLSASNVPSGATFPGSSIPRTFTWTPVYGQSYNSPYIVTFTANDGTNPPVNATATINVTFVPTPIIISSQAISNNQFQFHVSGVRVSVTNIIQASTNLPDFFPIQTNVATNTSFDFSDPGVSGGSAKVYRVLENR